MGALKVMIMGAEQNLDGDVRYLSLKEVLGVETGKSCGVSNPPPSG